MSKHIFVRRKRAGGGSLSSLSVVSNTQAGATTAAGVSITIPTVQDGDLLVLLTLAEDSVNELATFADIPGWTTIISKSGDIAQRSYGSLHCKIATAADSGVVVSGGAASSSASTNIKFKALLVVRGDAPISVVTPGSASGQYTTGNPTAQSVTLPGSGVVFVVGAYKTAGLSQTVATRTFTVSGVDAKDGEYREALYSNYDAWIAWKSFNTGASQANPVIVDMGSAGASILMSCRLACS